MNLISWILLAVITLAKSSSTPAQIEGYQLNENLIGTYKIDLRPTPDSEPYYQYFVITEVSESSITGTFYGTEN